jgi:hypothetical protein
MATPPAASAPVGVVDLVLDLNRLTSAATGPIR